MTTAALSPSKTYIENGVTLVYAVPFRFRSPQHISASRVSVAGVVTQLVYGTDYSVTGGETDAGGSLTVTVAGDAGTILRIKRVTPRAQTMDYTTGDTFPAESHEAALDTAMLIDQEQDVQIGDLFARALKVPDGETVADLPKLSDRLGKVRLLGHSASGVIAMLDPSQIAKGDPGGTAMAVGLFTALATLSIPVGTDVIRTSGFNSVGRGSAFYSLVPSGDVAGLPVEGLGVWYATSSNGRTFQLNEPEPNLYQYGAVSGGDVNTILPIADRHVMRTQSFLVLPADTFLFSGSLGGLLASETRIRGTRPVPDSGDTKLQKGSILRGSCWIKSPHADVHDFGVDRGSAWFGTAGDALKISPYNDGTGLPINGTFLRASGLIGLGNATDGFHAVLIEKHFYADVFDIEGIRNQFAVALKLVKSSARKILGRKATDAGRCIIIKADNTFGGQGQNDYTDFTAEGTGTTTYGISFLVQNSQQMEQLILRGARSSGCVLPCIVEIEVGSVCNELIIDGGFLSSGTGGNTTNAPLVTVGAIYNLKAHKLTLKPNLLQRSFILNADTLVDLNDIECLIPAGGIFNAGQIGGAGSPFLRNVRVSQAYDVGVPGQINFDTAAGKARCDNMCVFEATGAGAVIRSDLRASSIPTTGRFTTGEFVRNLVMTPDGNNMVVEGWFRMTSGTNHVLGTDWRRVFASTVSPAT